MRHRPPLQKHATLPAEAPPTVQPNAIALGKFFEAFQLLCGAATAATPPPANSSVVTASAAELVDALLQRMYRRMPKSGTKDCAAEHCPYTGLNRSALYELLSLRNEDGTPVIKNISMREANEKHGARYYSVGPVLNEPGAQAKTNWSRI